MLLRFTKVIGDMLLPLPLMLLIVASARRCSFSRFQKTGRVFISVGWLALLLSLQPFPTFDLLRPIENLYPTAGSAKGGIYCGSRRGVCGTRSGRQL